ncbi:baseplate J/gp47 family protein [uncultured Lactobacillus sp.]|uniref:baseplate J/gp47 family protein n=1 Tax=uncultured Lactobacillus sp. TaxID=153152 RepID=UPI002616F20E|nr:baseplate J/gp47 family protein [uncultured Lactobacillus sp.]
MNPNELAQEFEQQDSDYWLDLMLDRVPEDIDKREGSIIYDGLAPAAQLMGMQSLSMANIIRQTYIRTAQGEYLDYRAAEHGTNRYEATSAEVKAKFQDIDGNPINNVNIGDRFSSIGESPIFYTVTKINEDLTGELVADEKGTEPNSYLGQILPVTPNDELSFAEIKEVTIPARDAENDEHLRARILNANSWIAYGGNVSDYLDMMSKIREVGATQVYPTWQGPGTVKLVIVDNDYKPASNTLIKKVKEEIDPEDKTTQGYGLAPIDHRVTVVAPELLNVNIEANIIVGADTNLETVKNNIKKTLEDFFNSLRQTWSNIDSTQGRGYSMVVYRSKILSRIMMVEGVANSSMPKLNGKDEDIMLTFNNDVSQLPMLGEVTING